MTDSLVVNTNAPTYVRYFLLLYHYDTPTVFIVNIHLGLRME